MELIVGLVGLCDGGFRLGFGVWLLLILLVLGDGWVWNNVGCCVLGRYRIVIGLLVWLLGWLSGDVGWISWIWKLLIGLFWLLGLVIWLVFFVDWDWWVEFWIFGNFRSCVIGRGCLFRCGVRDLFGLWLWFCVLWFDLVFVWYGVFFGHLVCWVVFWFWCLIWNESWLFFWVFFDRWCGGYF